MKLCPLFESIQTPHKQRLEPPASFYDGLVAANRVLPREAIEAAIVALECDLAELIEISCVYTVDDLGGTSATRGSAISRHIEQLRAMLPVGE
jgi:hypothetical protein